MSLKADIINYLLSNKNRYKKEYRLTKIGIFGSIARDDFSENSDIDLMVEFEDNANDLYSIKETLRNEISEHFNRKVDICREKYIKSIFKTQILSETLYV